jgi:hypothetical protein
VDGELVGSGGEREKVPLRYLAVAPGRGGSGSRLGVEDLASRHTHNLALAVLGTRKSRAAIGQIRERNPW